MPTTVDFSLSVYLYSKWSGVWGGGSCSSNPRGFHSAWWASMGLWDEQLEMATVLFLLILLRSYYTKYSFFFWSWSLLTLLVCGIQKTHFELVASSFLIIINLHDQIDVGFFTHDTQILIPRSQTSRSGGREGRGRGEVGWGGQGSIAAMSCVRGQLCSSRHTTLIHIWLS